MRLLSWTSLCIFASGLCTTCLAGQLLDRDAHDGLELLEKRKKEPESDQSTVLDEPVAASTTDDASTTSATRASRTSNSPKTATATKTAISSQTSAAATTTSAATTKQTKTTTPTSSPPKSTDKPSSSSESSTPLTSTSSSSTSISTSSTSSQTSSTSIPQPTSILGSQPQSTSHVSVGGIVAGVVLGTAVLTGVAWIAIAKWRENKRHRAQYEDEESKRGFGGAGADGHYSSSQDSLLAGGKLATGSDGLKLKSLSPSFRAHSFVSSSQHPGARIPQDVLPPPNPAQYNGLPELPQAEHEYSRPLGSQPQLAEMPSPYEAMPPGGVPVVNSVPRKALPRINVSSPVYEHQSPSPYQRSPAAELPG